MGDTAAAREALKDHDRGGGEQDQADQAEDGLNHAAESGAEAFRRSGPDVLSRRDVRAIAECP
ncbi:hypothetical protein Aph02nite_91700 [Actinoplanes philippinensis]|nr:hypothetical protein Aph02nite_91700 [Actinoplanes philippinensis]